MKLKIIEPTELSEIPLQSYQKWMKVVEGTDDEELLQHKFVQIFLGLQLNEAVQIRANDIRSFMQSLAKVLKQKPEFKQTFSFGGTEYGFIPDLENISWGEYMDIEQNLTNWETYHIALSVMYRPITKKYKDTYEIMEYKGDEAFHELFKMIPLDIALSGSVFFYNLERELLRDTLLSLELEMKTQERMNTQKDHNSISNGGGITASIGYLRETLLDLTKLSPYLFINALPTSAMRSKKIRYNTMSKKDR
jgi:hypothetical protein